MSTPTWSGEPGALALEGAGKGRLVTLLQSQSNFANRTGDLDRRAEKETCYGLPATKQLTSDFAPLLAPRVLGGVSWVSFRDKTRRQSRNVPQALTYFCRLWGNF